MKVRIFIDVDVDNLDTVDQRIMPYIDDCMVDLTNSRSLPEGEGIAVIRYGHCPILDENPANDLPVYLPSFFYL